ncbi:MAG: hypothetical protein JXB34_11675 [Bacteroidales bacterium]|nr:hypothetical protein [Bacteroidales bacterium]
MKKLFILALVFFTFSASGQVFNTSSTLKRGRFSVGFEPGFNINGGSDFTLFLHGGAGLTKGADLGIKVGLLRDETYIGGDVEFALGKRFSLSVGAHSYYELGLDGTALFTFPLKNGVSIYTGLDMDIDFYDEVQLPIWAPIGLEVNMGKNMRFLFEAEINLTDVGYHFLGGGLNFYF